MSSIEALRIARKSPQRYLTQYLNLRSRIGGDIFITILEGKDDIPVYDVWLSQITRDFRFEPLQTSGKDNLIGIAKLVHASKEIVDQRVLFFIDHDFDGSRDMPSDPRFYVTNAYSIESFLVNSMSFEKILINDFGLVGDEQESRPLLINLFEDRINEFNQIAAPLNAYIRWLRLETDCEDSFPGSTSKAISISLEKIESSIEMNSQEICVWLGASATPTLTSLNEHYNFLVNGNLSLLGRGKFMLDFLKKLLTALYEDRRSSKPKYFTKPEKSLAEPTHDLLRKTASYIAPPACLREFIELSIRPPLL